MSTLATFASSARIYRGGCATGKTERLLDDVAALFAAGVPAADVLVCAATPDAALALRERLAAKVGPAAADATVTTPRAVALDILASDACRAFTGRAARLLAPFEVNVLMEDVKTSGSKPGVLKGMLGFFYRCWTECVDYDEGWLINDEERGVHAHIKGYLALTGGVMEYEVSNLALRYVLAHRDACGSWVRPHVFVDDYQLLSRASQMLANALASTSMTVACDPVNTGEVFEAFPYAAGANEFVEAYGASVQEEELFQTRSAADVARAVAGLCAEPCLGGAALYEADPAAEEGTFALETLTDPNAEFAAVLARVRSAVGEGVAPRDIYLIAPHKAWARNLRRGLMAAGVPSVVPVDAHALGGDVRNLRGCVVPRAFTLLALCADPSDGVAWRSWCGFGDYLLRNSAFMVLRARSLETGATLAQLLDALALLARTVLAEDGSLKADAVVSREGLVDPGMLAVLGMRDVVDAYVQGRALVGRLGALEGSALLEAIDAAVMFDDELADAASTATAPLAELAGEPGVCGNAVCGRAADLFDRVCTRLANPGFAAGLAADAVRVGDYEGLCGLTPQMVVATGFVDGFVPPDSYFDGTRLSNDRRDKLHDRLVRKLYAALGKARRELVVTCFEETEVESAEALGLRVRRIGLRGGKRVSRVSPSLFAEKLR